MKKLNIPFLLLVFLIPTSVFAESTNELKSAPFGFRWGDNLNEIKNKLTERYEVIEDIETCPFTIVKTNKLDDEIKNTGEYELLIMPKYKGINDFNGLIAISYKSKPANARDYHHLLKIITNNLRKEYGKLQYARSMDTMEHYYFFEGKNMTINVTSEQYKDYFHIDLEYAFTGNRNSNDAEENFYSIAKEMCKKQRNQHLNQ